jgi:hypothetical protein
LRGCGGAVSQLLRRRTKRGRRFGGANAAAIAAAASRAGGVGAAVRSAQRCIQHYLSRSLPGLKTRRDKKKKIILIAEVSFLKLWMNDVPSLVRVQLLHTVEETIQTLLVTVQKDAPPPPPLLPALRDLIADAFRRGAPEVSEKKTDFSTQRFNPRKTKGCSCSSGAECSVAEQG